MKKSTTILLWVVAFVLMGSIAVYQRMTGPTYPVRGTAEINGQEIKFKLPRSTDESGKDLISVVVKDQNLIGYMKLRRFKSHDEWSVQQMKREGDLLIGSIPTQPTAGKVMYQIYLLDFNGNHVALTKEPVVIRFKGVVPPFILIPHIFCMFFAMVLSMRAGLEGLFKGNDTYKQSLWTLIFFTMGGMLLGPIVQWYAFGAFWTGWPFGHDLTDNKTLAAFIFWLIAVLQLRKHPERRFWAVIAAIVLLAVYLIPHSVLGSEIDYTKLPK
jgi:hypothetical protein